jgi:hypothetical protein
MPTLPDKLLGEVVRLLLEAYYEPQLPRFRCPCSRTRPYAPQLSAPPSRTDRRRGPSLCGFLPNKHKCVIWGLTGAAKRSCPWW